MKFRGMVTPDPIFCNCAFWATTITLAGAALVWLAWRFVS
jgi:hypothetical protein